MTDTPCEDCERRIARWRAWLHDASVVDGETLEDFAALPDDGLLALVLAYEGGGGRVIQGDDFIWAFQGPADVVYAHSSRESDPARYLDAVVKRGRWTDDITMGRIESAVRDMIGVL